MTRFFSLAMLLAFASQSFAQLPVTDGLMLWLDATDADTISLSGGCVDEWSDKSGNDFSALITLDSDTACPAYETEAMNGQPAVRFHSETNDGMDILDIAIEERPYTAFIVNKYWGEARGRTLQGNGNNWLMGLWAGNVSHFASGFVGDNPAAIQDVVYVADVVGTETESRFFVNNADLTVDTSPAGIPGGLGLVGSGEFAGEVSDADISEVLFYDRELSAEEMTSVRTYLYAKYDAGEFAVQPPDELNLIQGSIGTFSSAADLDFSGDFAHAINLGGVGENEFGDPLTIGDAALVDGTNDGNDALLDDGIDITVANEIAEWHAPAYVIDTEDDENLAFAMQSIRWNVPPGIDITLPVEEGESYKLQMLFAESCCNRAFDITIEDELSVDNFNVQTEQGGINNQEQGVSYTHELVASDGELNISLGGIVVGAPDNNPILNVLTLEKVEAIVVDILGDCDGDGSLAAGDLACVTTIEERDAVLSAIPTLAGDLNGDGAVDFPDFLILSGNFGMEGASYIEGNIDLAGAVDFPDFLTLSGNFGATAAAAVPEPAGILMAMFSLCGLLTQRRRRS